ncbi:helix-turn-helix transcriptional regulator [Candidatus Binatus sp.]|uniref:helix-turn-helix transcriptional regulator n=1 Tax=Candidatus Binatus sp. TaxID=2811406 RepID=UPI002B470010|nr:LuxR C-terminal-related transcriptional regulator [Candidatus Binatus sp.]
MRKAPQRTRSDSPHDSVSLSLSDFSELLAAIYEGPLEAVPWKTALDLLRRHLRASYVTLMLRPPSAELEPLMVNSAGDWPITREAEYNKHYYALDPFVDLPPDRVFTVNELIGDANWRDSEFYKQFLKPLDILHALGADIRTDDGLECRLRVARPHREPPFSENDKLLCTSILPHLKRAVRLHSQLELMDSERRLYAGTVDRMLVGTVTLDETGAVLNSNPVADEVLREGDGLRLANGALRADLPAENRELQRLVKQALSGESGGRPAVVDAISITRKASRGKLGVLVRSLPNTGSSKAKRRPSVALFIRDAERKSEASREMVRRLFDLTPAEASLALALANGLTLDEAADALDIRKNTARAHLRAIFSKIGVTRQTTLVRVLLSSVIWLG